MIKFFCDICKDEAADKYFRCEVVVRQMKQAVLDASMNVQPQLIELHLHLCEKCYKLKFE